LITSGVVAEDHEVSAAVTAGDLGAVRDDCRRTRDHGPPTLIMLRHRLHLTLNSAAFAPVGHGLAFAETMRSGDGIVRASDPVITASAGVQRIDQPDGVADTLDDIGLTSSGPHNGRLDLPSR
jgi:hypothetical protein